MGKIVNILKIVIGVLAGILFLRIWFTGDDPIKESVDLQNSMLNPNMYLAYIIFGITVLLTLVFTIVGVFKGNVKKTLISIGAFVVVVALSYFAFAGEWGAGLPTSDTEVLSVGGAKWIGAGLYTFYILALVAVVAMLVSTVKKAITT
jgi:hypothetical protein